jgi:serine/threonine protein kinase
MMNTREVVVVSVELELTRSNLKSANRPEDVFGTLVGDSDEQMRKAKNIYRRLAKLTHEDLYPVSVKPIARESFVILNGLWEQAQNKIKNNTYGNHAVGTSTKIAYQPREIKLRNKTLILEDILAQGSFSTVYKANYEGIDPREFVVVKIARTPQDNELLEHEMETLNIFQLKDSNPDMEEFLSVQRMYASKPLTSFYISGENGTKHRAIILSSPNFRSFTLETLRKEKFPDGLLPVDVWWIFRRLLLTLWMAHLKDTVHGAVTPEHVLVYPDDHGLELLDWTCSCKIGKKVVAYNPAYRQFYAPEIFAKKPVSPATDIYMAGATAIYMLGGDHTKDFIPTSIPASIIALLRKCVQKDMNKRPQDAEKFHGEFGKALGKRAFHKMIVP